MIELFLFVSHSNMKDRGSTVYMYMALYGIQTTHITPYYLSGVEKK